MAKRLFMRRADEFVGTRAASETGLWREVLRADVRGGLLDDFLGFIDLL